MPSHRLSKISIRSRSFALRPNWGAFSIAVSSRASKAPRANRNRRLNRHQKEARTMLLDASFVAAVLEGLEGTLDEVVGRVASPELSADLVVLQTRINALRVSIEPPQAEN